MSKIHLTDDLLYNLVPKAEILLLEQIPPDEEITHRFSKLFKRKMKRLIKGYKEYGIMKSFRRVAIIVLVITSILLTTVLSVEALRTNAFRVIRKIYKELTSISFIVNYDSSEVDFAVKKPKYIPKGFKQIDINELQTMVLIIYEDEIGNQIIYKQSKISNGTTILDTEDATIVDIMINGFEGQMISKEGRNHLIWLSEEYHYGIVAAIDKKEIIKIAKSLK